MSLQSQNFMHEDEETDTGTPKRYLPLQHVYSATVPCVSASGSSNVMSKKVKARKIVDAFDNPSDEDPKKKKQLQSFLQVYTRRSKKPRGSGSSSSSSCKPSFFDSLLRRVESESNSPGNFAEGIEEVKNNGRIRDKKDKVLRNCEILKLGFEGFAGFLDCPRLRENRVRNLSGGGSVRGRKRKLSSIDCQENGSSGLRKRKRWVQVSFKDVDPSKFVGLLCKVYWPLDDDWYQGRVIAYNSEKREHQVKYEDGDEENLIFVNEKIKFQISHEEMERLNLKCIVTGEEESFLNYCEMAVLAAGFDDCQELEPGDIIWAKLAGHAMWPAVIVNESICKGLKPSNGEKSVSVQFFGTHDFARIKTKQVIPFLKGLFASFHLKCKRSSFHQGLEEAKVYLSEQKLPAKMLQMQNGTGVGDCESSSGEDEENVGSIEDEGPRGTLEPVQSCPFEIGDLCILNLGKIVKDSEYFHNKRYIWPEGYIAVRKYISVLDPSTYGFYKMEVLRDPRSKFKPLFRVIMDKKEKFKGSTPSACWKKIYRKIRKMRENMSNGCNTEGHVEIIEKSGSYMFGFSNRKVFKLIQELSYSSMPSMYSGCKLASKRYRDLPVGYQPVRVEWKDLDKCNVCHMDEEYENNLFLQCDKCRMMVHARCYGELEPTDGVLWLCNLCRLGVKCPPPCCLCPVIGGAMKRTTDGRWAHLACAIWIPETCLSDIKKMEPIDGLNRINKDRWKLLCSICGVAYGACIQCSNNTCRVAYHPLCARAAGLCVELEDEDKLHLMSFDEDEDDQCIRLLSYCKKHRQPSNERSPSDEQTGPVTRHCSNYTPPSNPSGCARTEPYDFLGRRGRKEPEALAAASLKRLYVENRPYLVTGYCQSGTAKGASIFNELLLSRYPSERQKPRTCQPETPPIVVTMAEKYKHMRETFRKRLACGKSGIHGFGIFAKHPHRAGDMVIEYTGEVVRPSVADRREHLIYNSLVGAGTYMFRVDDERVVDATRAGSIAHLINHSCEPNCYSRVISVHGDEHIIIFAKRDIEQWEELTYDYRFFSIDEQLACYCGFPRCRGVVNDIDAEEQAAKLYVPCSKLIDWKEE